MHSILLHTKKPTRNKLVTEVCVYILHVQSCHNTTVALEVTSTTPHSTSVTPPHSTSVTPLPPLLTPPLSLYFRQFHHLGSTHVTPHPQSIRHGVGGATSIATFSRCSSPNYSSVSDGSGSGSGKRGRLVSILEKCLLSGNEDKLMRVIESVVPSASSSTTSER